MNEEIKKDLLERLIKYLDSLEQAISSSQNFAADQAPEVIKEIITWGIVRGLGTFAVSMGIIFFIVKMINKAHKINHDDREFVIPVSYVVGGIIFLGAFIHGINSFFNACQAMIAPRLYILEYIKELVK